MFSHSMHMLIAALALVALIALIRAGASRARLQDPILLLLAGIILSFVPGVPSYRLPPEVMLGVVLPLLLFASAFHTSLPAFRFNLRLILLLSVGLTLFTTLVVGYVAYAVIPGLSLAAAMVLGAVVAPPDAVAASAVGRQVGMPRRVLTLLEGESLFNDAAALTAYAVAVEAVSGRSFSLAGAAGQFAVASLGGLIVGMIVAWLVAWLRARIESPSSDAVLSLLAPFLAYLPAEAIHASGLIAVVVVGLYLGHRSTALGNATSRIVSPSLWQVIQYVLEGAVFVLMGLQFADIVRGVSDYSAGTLAVVSAAVFAVLVVSRFAWIFPTAYLPQLLSRRLRERDPFPPWQNPVITSWAGMRGVVSLAAVMALPVTLSNGEPFPQRNLLVFLTFVVIAASLLLQGLTLPTLVRHLRLPPSSHPDHEARRDAKQEAEARRVAATAALRRLDELMELGVARPEVADQLRQRAENRLTSAQETLEGIEPKASVAETYRQLASEMIAAERDQLVRLRNSGQLSNEAFRRVRHEIDLDESAQLRQ